MNRIKCVSGFLVALVTIMLSGCTGLLDLYPQVDKTTKDVYNSVENYRHVLAKLYGSFVLAGQDKGGGDVDISGSRGFDYMRCYFNMQEIGTDEVAMVWHASDNQTGLSYLSWDSNDVWVYDMYYRIYYTIALCNEYIRNSSEEKLASFSEADRNELIIMRSEARFLRALAYSHALDLFRDVPFVDETQSPGTFLPPKYSAQQIFDYIVNELTDIAKILPEHPLYPHAGAASAYGLLARVNLNAETYGCGCHYDDCVSACNNVIELGYENLEPKYMRLFGADNHKCTDEILFAFAVDNEHSVSWGASTYIVCAQSHSLFGAALGVGTQSWGIFRCRSQIPSIYDSNDGRNLFYTTDREPKITDLADDSVGYFYMKWNNLTDEGKSPDKTTDGVCTDLPIIRLADIYLMKAESYLRGAANVTQSEALACINVVRKRAFGNSEGNISAKEFTLDFMLKERARELSIEMVRRTDLIRFGCFTTDKYLWDFKGGQIDGVAVDDKYNVYPIPYAEQTANPNMKQDY